MKPLALVLSLALAGCAATAPQSHGGAADAGDKVGNKGGGMMDEMCKRHAADPGRAASAPETMMDRHCKPGVAAPAGAASHVH